MISIIIPTFNSENTIKRAVESVIQQTYTDWEILIIDGGSRDGTLSIVSNYSCTNISIVSEPDNGVYDAMNKGIRKSHGEWLYFLGSDDYLLHNNTLDQVSGYLDDGIDIVYGDVESTHLDPRHSGEWSIDLIHYNRCHQGIFYRRKVFDVCGLYNLKYFCLADYDMNLKWFFSRILNNKYIPIVIAHFSDGGISSRVITDPFKKEKYRAILYRGWRHFTLKDRIYLMRQWLTL